MVLYAVRNYLISTFKFFFSVRTIFKILSSPFAWGHQGVEVLCCMPFVGKNAPNSLSVNCGPLSVLATAGDHVYRQNDNMNIFSRLPTTVTDLDVTDFKVTAKLAYDDEYILSRR